MREQKSKRWPSRPARYLGCVLGLLFAAQGASAGSSGISIEEAIETTRLMTNWQDESVFVSPDGARYAVMLITGDVERDGVWLEIRVGALSSIRAARPVSIVRLFTRGLGAGYAKRFGSDELTAQSNNPPVWIDPQTLAFLWEDERGVRQVYSVNVHERVARALTQHSTPVMGFTVSPTGSLTYAAAIARDLAAIEQRQSQGYAVTYGDAIQLLNGGVRGPWDWMMHERYLLDDSRRAPRRVDFEAGDDVGRYSPSAASWSPDGRRLIVAQTVSDIPSSWGIYTQRHLRMLWDARQRDPGPDPLYARQYLKLFVVDVMQARGRALWEVPVNVLGPAQIAWSADGRHVAMGPTVLPGSVDDEDALEGRAAAVVDVDTGAFERLPLPGAMAGEIQSLSWTGPLQVDALLADGTLRWQRQDGEWALTHRPASAKTPVRALAHAGVTVSVRESLNTPPTVWATDRRTGRAQEVFDPNPRLRKVRLGDVQWLSETRTDGAPWEGRLYYPLNYRPGRAYPLVVQTYAFTPRDQFSLYGHRGPALGPGRSAYIAQVLATHDMFVLHGPSRGTFVEEVSNAVDELETQIEKLIARGLVDRTRVGIMGFSASGWFTTVALTRGRFAYAAALTDDNKDGSYFQAGLSGWDYGMGEQLIGAPPFGEGLKRWLEYSPAMNVESIRTPLLMTRSSPGLPLNGWELFSRLRHLRKPVEYYFIPDVEHGNHGLQNPRQLRALQGRALDWWRFWLKDERDPDPAKHPQYAAWETLRELQLRSAR